MNITSSLTKVQRRTALSYSLMKMKFYLKENGIISHMLKKNVITRAYAEMKYSETVLNIDEWILDRFIDGDFEGMKTGRKKKIAKTSADGEIIKVNYPAFLKTKYWMGVRQLVITRDGNKCTRCDNTKRLQAHHITYENHFNEHNHLEDLITLCKSCHLEEHEVLNKKKEELYSQYNIPIIPIIKPKKKKRFKKR